MRIKNLALCGAFVVTAMIISSCSTYNSMAYQKELGVNLADTLASKETVTLFRNLKELSKHSIIFGHHHTTEYGIGWRDQPGRSDVKEVCGSYPGVYGWDFGTIPTNDSGRRVHHTPQLVREAFERGGVNTFCWHVSNPVTGRIFYDTTIAVRHILPGGAYHARFLQMLDTLVDYNRQLVDSHGTPIPVIFRPWHEFDGSWFWWGKNFCTRDEFIRLWRLTVGYLRDVKGVRNFLYAFSPDRKFWSEQDLLERYPGDDVVDVIGVDNYYDFTPEGDSLQGVTRKLRFVTSVAERRGKIAAFTETGSERIPDSTWWTSKLYRAMDDDSVRLAYVMVWRNAHRRHFYAPYPGHPSVPDFLEFRRKPKMLFEDDLPPMYSAFSLPEFLSALQTWKNSRQGTQ